MMPQAISMGIQCPFNSLVPAEALLTQLWHIKEDKDAAKEEDIDLPSPQQEISDDQEILDEIEDYLNSQRGVTGLPLARHT